MGTSSTRLAAACVTTAILCAVAPRAHDQSPPAPSSFTSVELVLVDLRVSRGGEPVPDLRPDEVTLLVDGAPRPVASLIYAPVVVPAERRNRARETAAGPAPPAQASQAPARRLVFVIDRGSIEPGEARQLQKTTEQFIERVPAGVAIAVATLPLGPGIRFEPDRAATIKALRRALEGTLRRGSGFEGISGFGCTGPAASAGCGVQGIHPDIPVAEAREANRAAEWIIRGRKTLGDLEWIFRALAGSPGDVVIASGGLPYFESPKQGLRADIERAFTVARAAGVRVHAVEVGELTRVALPEGALSTTLDLESLHEKRPAGYGLPEETGGVAMTGAVSGADFFKQLARELSSTYLLSFEPTASDRDGTPHAIEIRLSRTPRPTVHARKTFVLTPTPHPVTPMAARPVTSPAPPPTRPAPPPEAPSASGGSEEIAETDAIPLLTVMQRASAYVDTFEQTLSNLVAEERYVQLVKYWYGDPPTPGKEPELAWKPGKGEQLSRAAYYATRRRQLLSDVLLVQPPGQMWIGYRDVAEVDGKPVRDRALRIEKLFLSNTSTARAQLQRIADESARHNLGSSRNINIPTFPLQILRPANLGRFEWTTKGQERAPGDPAACTVLGFRETSDPTLVKTNSGRNVPMTGQFCIEPDTGRVWRATLNFRERFENVQGAFEVTFRPTTGDTVLLPDRAWEWSLGGSPLSGDAGTFVEGEATYSNLRRFSVNTEEQLK
jgi:VWFA-related protein